MFIGILAKKRSGGGSAIPVGNLVSYYNMDNVVTDGVGSNDGTYSGAYTTGKSGQAIDTTSTNLVNCGNDSSLHLTQLSISCYLNTTTPGAGYRGGVIKQSAYGFFLVDGVLGVHDWGGGGLRTTGVSLDDGNWYHIAITYDSGIADGLKVYLDSVLILTDSFTVADQTKPLTIGSGTAASQQIAAKIDGVGIWNTLLDQTQVDAIYAEQLAGNELV